MKKKKKEDMISENKETNIKTANPRPSQNEQMWDFSIISVWEMGRVIVVNKVAPNDLYQQLTRV